MTSRGRISRRRLLTHSGAAAAGAVATSQILRTPAADWPRRDAPPRRSDRAASPYGEHQPGILRETPAALEVVALDLLPDVDREAMGRLLRVWTGNIEAATAALPMPGDPQPQMTDSAAIAISVGLGPDAFRGDMTHLAPPGLQRVPPMQHDRLQPAWSGGSLVLIVSGASATTTGHVVRRMIADAQPFAQQRWRQVGSWHSQHADGRSVTGRNLFGQVDGTANPRRPADLDEVAWISTGRWRGGTTLVVRRIRMDLDAWDELTPAQMEHAVGRRLSDGAPLTGGGESTDVDLERLDERGRPLIAENAHVRVSHPSVNGGIRIVRRGANWTRDVETRQGVRTESGLLFLSYQADIAKQYVPLQTALDRSDALNEWTTAIGSAEFALLPGFRRGSWLGAQVFG